MNGSAKAIRVVIVRHGESTFNIEKRIQGRSDLSSLTERGLRQAQQVAQALRGIPFGRVYASPLQRALLTAQQIAPAPEISPLLREIDLSEWEGLTFDEVRERYPDDHQRWRQDPDQLRLADRYPVQDLWQQAERFWQAQDSPDPNLVVVGHSGINRALIGTRIGLTAQHYHRLGQDNCAISILNFPHGLGAPAQLESLNLTAHLNEPLPKAKAGIRILLVRHGETQWNREQRFQGQIDVPLNAQGQQQAEKVGQFLGAQPIDLAFSSPLQRPWATATAICNGSRNLMLQSIPDLQEICHGEWEGKLQSEIEAEFPGLLEAWQRTPAAVQMPGGENLAQVWQRSRSAWQGILQESAAHGPTTTTLVVAHDAINKAILCQLFDLGPEHFWTFKQGNGAVTVIDYPDGIRGQPVLRSLNITAHLFEGVLDRTAAGAL